MKQIANVLPAERLTRPANCETHGSYISTNIFGTVWTHCPTCESERLAKEKLEREEFKRKQLFEEFHRKVGDSGIPERFRSRRFSNFVASTDQQKYVLEFCKEYAESFDQVLETGRSAIFVGAPGTGKTHLACAIGMHVMGAYHRTALFSTVMRAVRRVKSSWSRNSLETETQAIEAMVFPDLLILDEVGVQFGSDSEKMILFDVINERYENRRPTLLMSNLSQDEVVAYVGERIIDRMREDGGKVIAFTWDSHRRVK
ncbi:ATP-binding protein [Nitrosomonas sp. Nm34]|uniref:ATP-binding protein n=1 Tax=Nitrosomonas sp. Nm34 TaxID=1881055 RepID=UPI0008F062B1|nr:ATP-binding protein [Nitrosomonas sp. Nm34]SFI76002.1 DNA replication protein DnaC [Nitrosomonas sp. Nm34]